MAWVELSAQDYAKHFANPLTCYLGADFNLLNAQKVDAVRFFAYDREGFRLGIVFGETPAQWLSPFSAPFGGFACAKGVAIDEMDGAIASLPTLARSQGKSMHITLAPVFYAPTFLSKCVSSLLRAGFKVDHADLNYALSFVDPVPYEKRLWNMAKRNLKQAQKCQSEFRLETTPEGVAASYGVIAKNREFKGYPLKMSQQAFGATSALVPIEYFTLYLAGAPEAKLEPAAAAIVYRVSPHVAHLIYWGEAPGFEELRPMNLLALRLYEHYQKEGVHYLDIGPSCEDGVPNVGLCAFKESVGCFADLKYTFSLEGGVC